MRRVRIGVIGAGNWGRNHVRTLATMPEVELTSVCDIDPSRQEEIGPACE
jgi:predicted dehydrogenase